MQVLFLYSERPPIFVENEAALDMPEWFRERLRTSAKKKPETIAFLA